MLISEASECWHQLTLLPHSSCNFPGSWYDGDIFHCILDMLAVMLGDNEAL